MTMYIIIYTYLFEINVTNFCDLQFENSWKYYYHDICSTAITVWNIDINGTLTYIGD